MFFSHSFGIISFSLEDKYLPGTIFEDEFPFRKVGYVTSLEGKCGCLTVFNDVLVHRKILKGRLERCRESGCNRFGKLPVRNMLIWVCFKIGVAEMGTLPKTNMDTKNDGF